MAIDQILCQLDGIKRTGPNQFLAKCPAHEDRTASLSIRETDDGRILLHDFAGCEASAVLRALGLKFSDLYPKPLAHHLPSVRRGYSARELLEVIGHEADVIWILLEQIPSDIFTRVGLDRLNTACERIAKARAHARGY